MSDAAERAGGDVGPRCRACGVRLRRVVAYRHPDAEHDAPRCWRSDNLNPYIDYDYDDDGSGGGGATARGGRAAGDAGAERPGGAGAGGDAAPGAGVRGAAVRRTALQRIIDILAYDKSVKR